MIRISVALLALLMATGAVAQKKPTTPSFVDGNDVVFCTQVQGGPNWSCKNPKTGKTMKVECRVPPKLAKSMPKQMSLTELRKTCITGNTKQH